MLQWLVLENVLVFLSALKIVPEDVLVFLKIHFRNVLSSVLVLYSLYPYTDRILQPHLGQRSPPSLTPDDVAKFTHSFTQLPIIRDMV